MIALTARMLVLDSELEKARRTMFSRESSTCWDPRSDHNELFLRAQQNYFNDMLHVRGHVFLNEVHDALGLPRIQLGQLVGWKRPENIEFRPTVNVDTNTVMLWFNFDDFIYDTFLQD